MPEHIQLDHQSGLPILRLQTSPEECPQSTPPPQKSAGQPSVKMVGFIFWCFLGNLLSFSCQRRNWPGRHCQRRKGHSAKQGRLPRETAATMAADDPLREDLETQLEQLRAALKDPRNPTARLDSAMAKMRKAEAKVLRCEEQLCQAEAFLKSAHAEKEEASSELKAAQENAAPKQQEVPPGDVGVQLSSEDITNLTDMLKQCGLLACCGGRRRCLRGTGQKGKSRAIRKSQENAPGGCKVSQPRISGRFSVARAPPCQTGRPRNSRLPVPCPTSKLHPPIWAGPTLHWH